MTAATGDIRTRTEVHAAECMTPRSPTVWQPGRVRRCPHRIMQESIAVPGWGPCCWRDLHWLWTPRRWRRARRALAIASPIGGGDRG